MVSMDVEGCALEAERKVLVLKFWGGLKSRKIGEKMNIEEGHINVIVF